MLQQKLAAFCLSDAFTIAYMAQMRRSETCHPRQTALSTWLPQPLSPDQDLHAVKKQGCAENLQQT